MDASHPSHSEGTSKARYTFKLCIEIPLYNGKAAIIQAPWIYQPFICFCLYYSMLPTLCLPVAYLLCLSVYNLSTSCVYENIQDYKNLLQFWFLTISRHKPYYPFKGYLSLGRYTGQVAFSGPFPFLPSLCPHHHTLNGLEPWSFPRASPFPLYPKVWHPQVYCQVA